VSHQLLASQTCLVGFGYRTEEMRRIGALPAYGPIQQGAQIKIRRRAYEPMARCPVRKSLGCHVEDHCLPEPDLVEPESVKAGCEKRFCHAPPPVNIRVFYDEFLPFVRNYVETHYTPLAPEADVSVDTWLANSSYPEWRRSELREAHERLQQFTEAGDLKKLMAVKSFIKDETYPTFKYPRPINSRSDEFKTLVGPCMKLIEKEVFADPSFIKKIPRDEWPSYLEDIIKDREFIYISDYSSFEALFEDLMEVELYLYKWMLQYHPDLWSWVSKIGETNYCEFAHVTARVWRKRMSGEMNTSLGNGFTAHMVAKFLVWRKYGKAVQILQEGDDTIFASPGPLEEQDFLDLGLEVKLLRVPDVSVGQFCQLLYDPDEMIVIRDPVQYVVSFGWCGGAYIRTDRHDQNLLMCKALSCISQYPGHPIVQPMAYWVLRCLDYDDCDQTRDNLILFVERQRSIDDYTRLVYMAALKRPSLPPPLPISFGTRLLVETLFGVSVEVQQNLEDWFDCSSTLQPIPRDLFGPYLCLDWAIYYEWYVRPVQPQTDHLWRHVTVGPQVDEHVV